MAQGGLPDLLLPPGEDPPGPPNSGTPQELEAHPGLAQLLRNLGGLLGGDGLSPPLQLQLRQAEQGLRRARALWLHLELLWRLLGELIRDPRDLEPDVLQSLERALSQARLRRGPPEIARLLPPPEPPQLLPRLLPEFQRRLKEKREQLQEFLLGTPKIPQIHPKNPQTHQNHPKITPNVPKNHKNQPKMPQNPPKILENPPKMPPKTPKNRPETPQNPLKIHQNLSKIPPNPPKIMENPPKASQIPPKIAQNPPKIMENPPKTSQIPPKTSQIPPKIPQIPPKIAQNPPENPPQNRQNFPEIPQNFPEMPRNVPELPEIAEFPPKTPRNGANLGAWLGAERERLRRERLRERRLREELQRLRWKYPQVLQRCVSLLSQLRLQGALQARLDEGRGRYLLAKGGAVLLKSRLEELQILMDTYPAPTIEAHRRIRAGLSEARRAAEAEAAILGEKLAVHRALGPEFRGLALELGQIQQELAQKGWALRQLRPSPP